MYITGVHSKKIPNNIKNITTSSIMSLYLECPDCDFSGRSASSIQNPRDGVDVKKMEAHPQSPGKKTK